MRKISMLLGIAILASGCATTSSVEELESKVSILESKLARVNINVAEANATADNAEIKAGIADSRSIQAMTLSTETAEKVNRLFRKTQMK